MNYLNGMTLEFVTELSTKALRDVQNLIRYILISEKCVGSRIKSDRIQDFIESKDLEIKIHLHLKITIVSNSVKGFCQLGGDIISLPRI